MLNNGYEVAAAASKLLGYSINTTNQEHTIEVELVYASLY